MKGEVMDASSFKEGNPRVVEHSRVLDCSSHNTIVSDGLDRLFVHLWVLKMGQRSEIHLMTRVRQDQNGTVLVGTMTG